MTSPEIKRFDRDYLPIADAISRLDIPQTIREQVAEALTEAMRGRRDFRPKLFWLLAADPTVTCAGYGDVPCPWQRQIRVAMHNRNAPDGRSFAWQETKPTPSRCADCGFRHQTLRGGE